MIKYLNLVLVLVLAGILRVSALDDIAVPTNIYDGDTVAKAVVAAPTVTASADGLTNTVSIAAKSQNGDAIAGYMLARVWTAETSMGAPSTNNIESLTLSGGTAVQTVTAAADYIYLTGAAGTASAAIVGTAAGTNYVMVSVGGYTTAAAVVFTE